MVCYDGKMGNILEHISQLALNYPTWREFIIGIAILLQGEIAILLSVYLIINKSLTWSEFFAIALGTLVIAENLLYITGRIIRTSRFGWKLSRKIKEKRSFNPYFFYIKKNLIKLLVISKFLGINLITLPVVGWSRVTFRKFFKSYAISLTIWFSSMTLVAYGFNSGLHYLKSEKIFRDIEIGILIIAALIIGGEYALRKIWKRIIALEIRAEDIGETIEEKIGSEK